MTTAKAALLMIVVALTLMACTNSAPNPADQGASKWNLAATLEARAAPTNTVEEAIHVTVEAKTRSMKQDGQDSLQAEKPGNQNPPTAINTPGPTAINTPGPQTTNPPRPSADSASTTESCDDTLKSRLLFQANTYNAASIQAAVWTIQNEQPACIPAIWNPVVTDPNPGDPETCLSWFDGISPERLPTGLLTTDGKQPRPISGQDSQGNVIVYWSQNLKNRPAQSTRCWIYLSSPRTWLTGLDLGTIDPTVKRTHLTEGDCIVFETKADDFDATPKKVSCDEEWSHRMLGSFEVMHDGPLPNDNYFLTQALQQCNPKHTFILMPAEQSWQLGDRQVQCLQESYGLSLSNPEKLARLTGMTDLQNGNCFNDAPETYGEQVEVVDCSNHWEMRVLNTIQIPASEHYPRQQEIDSLASANCDRRTTGTLYPTPGSWAYGDRSINCIQDNLTGVTGISSILDRLVNTFQLTEGECFNEYETAELYLAELTDCSRGWEFQVIRTITLPEGEYPGEDYIADTLLAICEENTTYYLYPTELDWELGNRTATCLTEQAEPTVRTPEESKPSEIVLNGNVPPITPTPTPQPTPQPTAIPPPQPTPEPTTIPTISEYHKNRPPPPTIPTLSEAIDDRPPSPHLAGSQNDRWLAQSRPQIAAKLSNLPWVSDGLSPLETEIKDQLTFLYVANNTPEAASILDMPFLQSIEPGDLQAVISLKEISRKSPSTLQRIVNHPTFSTGGISNDWTPVIAVLLAVFRHKQNLISVLLDPTQVHLETRTTQTSLAGPVVLNIIRTGPQHAKESMNRLEYAVHNVESFMGTPFPTDTVTVLYADAVSDGKAGQNFISGISILPKHDTADSTYAQTLTTHEIAHHYWTGNQNWINEGMADFIAAHVKASSSKTRVLPRKQPCNQYTTIPQIPRSDKPHSCDYSLGVRLFIDLYDAVGQQEFQRRMTTLYRESTDEDDADSLKGTKLTISHLRPHFTSPAAKEAINRWYDGSAPYRTDLFDRNPVNPRISVLNAQVTRAGLSVNNKPISSFSSSRIGSQVVLSIDYSHVDPVGTPGDIQFQFALFYQDGHPVLTRESTVHATVGSIGTLGIGFHLWSPGHQRPATGEYVAYVYEAGNKVAQVHWTVTP